MITDQTIIDMILRHEGGRYTDDPVDAGGPTKWGVTIPVLSQYLGRRATVDDIRNLSMETAGKVYRMLFVAPFSRLPDPLRVNVIDMGVNAGQHRAVVLLQQTIGATVDGKLGPQTVNLSAARDWNRLYVGVRLAFYEDLIVAKPSQIKWRNGWRNRALSFDASHEAVRMSVLRLNLSPRVRKMPLRWNATPTFGRVGKAYTEAA
jgi:lysozyme family protein